MQTHILLMGLWPAWQWPSVSGAHIRVGLCGARGPRGSRAVALARWRQCFRQVCPRPCPPSLPTLLSCWLPPRLACLAFVNSASRLFIVFVAQRSACCGPSYTDGVTGIPETPLPLSWAFPWGHLFPGACRLHSREEGGPVCGVRVFPRVMSLMGSPHKIP